MIWGLATGAGAGVLPAFLAGTATGEVFFAITGAALAGCVAAAGTAMVAFAAGLPMGKLEAAPALGLFCTGGCAD